MAAKKLQRVILLMALIVVVAAKHEKQIKLEDIEHDNLRSEKSQESLETQQSQHLRPPSLVATNNYLYSNPADQGKEQVYLPPAPQHSQQLYLIRPSAQQQQQQQRYEYVQSQQQVAPQPHVHLQYLPQQQPQSSIQLTPQMYYIQYVPQKQTPVYQQPPLQYSLPQAGIQYTPQQTYSQPAQEYEAQSHQQVLPQIHYAQQPQQQQPIIQYVIQQTPATHYTQPRQPQSLLDSYVPSYLQLERFKQLELKSSVGHGIPHQAHEYESVKSLLGGSTILNHVAGPQSLKLHSQRDVGLSVHTGYPESYNTIAYSTDIRPRIQHHKRTSN